jgi:hypothetical protein
MDIDIINSLQKHADTNQSPLIDYKIFLDWLRQYAQNDNNAGLLNKINDHQIEIIPSFVEWEYRGKCTLVRKDGIVTSIIIHSILEDKIKHKYYLIENDPHIAFPSEENFKFPLPPKVVENIDINSGFVNLLGSLESFKKSIIKLSFPHNVQNLIVPKEYVKTKLLECCVYKIRNYLQERMNVGYMTSRLEVVLSGTLSAIKNMLNDIVTKPKKAVNQLYEVDDFVFKFWSQLSNVMIQDFKEKKDKLSDEHGYCQSAYILGLYIGYQKAIIQKRYQKNLDLKHLEILVKKPPYAFTLNDLYDLKDSKGIRYSEKYSRDFIHDFIHKSTKVETATELPFLIRIKVDGKTEFFIQKDLIVPLFLNKLHECSRILRLDLMEEWQALLKNNIKIPSMKDDLDFSENLRRRIKRQYKLLYALLNPHLLYISKLESNISQNNLLSIERCFAKGNKLKTLPELLSLNRTKLLREVKTVLPLWFTMPIIKQFFFLFRWLFGKGRQKRKQILNTLWESIKYEFNKDVKHDYADLIMEHKNEQSVDTEKTHIDALVHTKDKSQKYKQAVNKIKESLIGSHTTLDEKLEELAEKWNPLFDPSAKKDLVEDVNALIRDFLRSIKRTFKIKPPTLEQVRNLASDLAMNKNLKDIKRKESLRMYIEIYMIKVLEERFIYQLL